MTRKHFKLMAEIISKIMAEIISKIENLEERKQTAEHNARICAKSNPKFDGAKFFRACGL